jgi:hypothetical protein
MKSALTSLIQIFLALTLAGCGFEPALTPVVWPTYPVSSDFGQVSSTPYPYPTPTSPFLYPVAPVPFEGADSLDCGEPQAGDNHFGYCLVLGGSGEVYVWGECPSECPEGPYPGIEILRVPFEDSAIFRDVIDLRDTNREQRRQGRTIGGYLGGIGAALGIPGTVGVCIKLGVWPCFIAAGIVLVDGGIAALAYSSGQDADERLNSPFGLEFSAEDQFRLLRAENEPEAELSPCAIAPAPCRGDMLT